MKLLLNSLIGLLFSRSDMNPLLVYDDWADMGVEETAKYFHFSLLMFISGITLYFKEFTIFMTKRDTIQF